MGMEDRSGDEWPRTTPIGSVEKLTQDYFSRLREIGVEGLYPASAAGFRLVRNGIFTEVQFDGFENGPRGWIQIQNGLRGLKVELKTEALEQALQAFATLATKYYEGKPSVLEVHKSLVGEVKRNCPWITEVPAMQGYVGIRGTLNDMKHIVLTARIPFYNGSLLETPKGESPILWGGTTGEIKAPTIYRLTHERVDTKERIIEYASAIDRVLNYIIRS